MPLTTAALLTALLVQAPSQPPTESPGVPASVSAADSLALQERVRRAGLRFFAVWQDEWKESERDRLPVTMRGYQEAMHALRDRRFATAPGADGHRTPFRNTGVRVPPLMLSSHMSLRRLPAVRCWYGEDGKFAPPTVIRSAVSRQSFCPGWVPAGSARTDEAETPDSAILAYRRKNVTAARRRLIALLDSAARRLPGDELIVGQRVRFLVDAGLLDRASGAARACGARPAWCTMLAGYVLARQGAVNAADSTFAVARGMMDDAERCAWDNTTALLDAEGAAAYEAMSCAERAGVDERLWWTARPFLRDRWNERRVEHLARKVRIGLHAALGRDERHVWRITHAGDALALMLERYGWPTYAFWGGEQMDEALDRLLRRHQSPPSPPYLAPEYAVGRTHLVPAWRAIVEPTRARSDDWAITAPDPQRPGLWWPQEHVRLRGGPILPLLDGQQALLRRTDGAQIAVAVDLDASALGRAPRAPMEASLVLSTDPARDSVWTVAHANAAAGGRVVLSGWAGTAPALFEVEVPRGAAGTPAARTRFGVTPPPPLAAMRRGEVAVSEPVLLLAGTAAANAPNTPDAAIAQMLGSTRLRARRFGVYWESYGFAPGDTVDVEVRLERTDRPGALERLASALDGTGGADGVVVMRWREPRSGGSTHVVDGPVPVVTRSVVLDAGRIPAGRYTLDVSVARPGGPAARGRRELTLE